jgi:glycosyltransferase involved in cell wall biosynthesis
MNIGIMITPKRTVPPSADIISAPKHLVVALADGLIMRGHATYLFAAKGSHSRAPIYDFGIQPSCTFEHSLSKSDYENKIRADEGELFRHMVAFGSEKGIQVYHLHQTRFMKELIEEAPRECQFVITLHDPLDGVFYSAFQELIDKKNVHFVSISKSQQREYGARFIATVPNGVDVSLFPFCSQSKGYIATMGRIVPEKGQDDAIAVSHATGDHLFIIGKHYQDTEERMRYWDTMIAPFIDNTHITHIPVIPRDTLFHYYQDAKALLMPIKWEEPFGLVMTESMACGTPVIAYNRGSIPEIIQDGVTGFIIDPDDEDRPGKGSWIIKKQGIAGLIEAVGKIGQIDRSACRKHVEDTFTLDTMVDGYEQVYEKIVRSS